MPGVVEVKWGQREKDGWGGRLRDEVGVLSPGLVGEDRGRLGCVNCKARQLKPPGRMGLEDMDGWVCESRPPKGGREQWI